ncbi:cupin-like domain-containing protein [Pseudoalteromonas tunicata]|uniref:cupin-like domain-containing protein n=1 Tax=Pseudoalteromonas tunicata TaxID=314281 RepID=UPI00273F8D8E|nr:cupin-like domain-containing protein [Pseudoalteromonas tunicata]MDP5211455.1 cupin-like domain-containing protein [Pseudoalteromonas tunicata]
MKINREMFDKDVLKNKKPVLLKAQLEHWPLVINAKQSHQHFLALIKTFDIGEVVDCVIQDPIHKGRIFYNSSMTGFNFEHKKIKLTDALVKLSQWHGTQTSPSFAIQSAPILHTLPKMLEEHTIDLIDPNVIPRIWLGTDAIVPAHYDNAENLACVISGKRRFTLFPPEQIENLYIGPIDFAPTGAAISLVDFNQPDFERFPKFKEALSHAQVFELEPGDVLYIPSMWWHHVESYGQLNTLVNYWWGGTVGLNDNPHGPYDTLLHGLLTIKSLPKEEKKAWQALFNFYLFEDNDAFEHIPEQVKGILGKLSPQKRAQLANWLIQQLKHELK